MARVVVLVVLTLLTITPVATACSFAEEPPPPGRFFLWTPDDGVVAEVEVKERRLGASCGLYNDHALHGGLFAWETGDTTFRVQNLSSGATDSYTIPSPDGRWMMSSLGVAPGMALVHARIYGATEDRSILEAVVRVDLDDGATATVIAPTDTPDTTIVVGDDLVAVQRNGNVSVLEAHAGTWRLTNATLSSFGAPNNATVRAVDQDGLVLAAYGAYHVHLWGENGTHAIPWPGAHLEGTHATFLGLDVEELYLQGGYRNPGIHVLNVSTSDNETFDEYPHPALGGVDNGRVVLGTYSDPRGLRVPFDVPLPGMPFLILVVCLASLAMGRRP